MNTSYEPPVKPRKIDTSRRFTKEEVWNLRRRVRDGEKMAHLADECGVSRPCIASAVHGVGTYEGV